VRKRYKKIIWSVGIWEKAVLRWRRKGAGLRRVQPERPVEGTTMQIEPAKEDDYDFLKEGRKQTEARMEKALARVKSMVQYPEARDQYRRLLTVVTELQVSNVKFCFSLVNFKNYNFTIAFWFRSSILAFDA